MKTAGKKLLSFSLAIVIALGILVCPVFADDVKAYTKYTGISTIDDFLNDSRWSEEVSWDSSSTPKLSSASGTGCYAYCADYTKYCYGYNYPNSGDAFYDINEIRVGDVLTSGNPSTWNVGHWFICIKRVGDVITIAEGNAMDMVLMEREFTIDSGENRFIGDRAERGFLTGYHYLSDPGTGSKVESGWNKDNGTWYYYDDNGNKTTGWKKIDYKWYYFDSDGAMVTGWVSYNGYKYYMDLEGVMVTGPQMIDDTPYYFDEYGRMATGWMRDNDYWYYFDSDGGLVTGWVSYNGYKYYMDEDYGIMRTGFVLMSGDSTPYYFYDNGRMATGWVLVDGEWYYFNSDGTMLCSKWLYYKNKWYYLEDSGIMATGWIKYNGYWYYLNDGGDMATGWKKINGWWYYFEGNGRMKTGWMLIDGDWYYFNSNGTMFSGWLKYKNNYYYVNTNGKMAHDTTVDGYYLDSNGVRV